MLDVDRCIERLYECDIIPEEDVRLVCAKVKELLVCESNVHRISSPVTIVGDVHGQFWDVIELFRISGKCPDTNFVFLGDYVDRGFYSVETISLLACLKLRYPDRVTLLRGNHESRQITQVYGFYNEVMRKYGNPSVWHYFTELFDFLTVACLIDDHVFCVHGGLSPSIHTLDQIRVLERFREIPHCGAVADLVWSDPDPEPERGGFLPSNRGAGYNFGQRVVDKFLRLNNVDHILRAHQLCMTGYQVLFNDCLSTVWSAPNYCFRCGNLASVLEIDEHLQRRFNTFTAAPESERQAPAALPNATGFL